MAEDMEAEREAEAAIVVEAKPLPKLTRAVRSNIAQDLPVYIPPDTDRHVLRNYPLNYILPYVNMQMLMGHHLGLKGNVEQLLASKIRKRFS